MGENSIEKWRKLIGPTCPNQARKENPSSIRALFGQDKLRNACHGSNSVSEASQELEFFFGQNTSLKVLMLILVDRVPERLFLSAYQTTRHRTETRRQTDRPGNQDRPHHKRHADVLLRQIHLRRVLRSL